MHLDLGLTTPPRADHAPELSIIVNHCFYQFNKSLLNKKIFLKKNKNTELLNGSVYCHKIYILNKFCSYLTFYSSKTPEKCTTGFLHKMYFKVYYNFDAINAGLMTISDLLQKI